MSHRHFSFAVLRLFSHQLNARALSLQSGIDALYFEGSWYVISGHTASPAAALLTIPCSPVC